MGFFKIREIKHVLERYDIVNLERRVVCSSQTLYDAKYIHAVLEKSIPMKPRILDADWDIYPYFTFYCGYCDKELEIIDSFCPNCGQAIDKSEYSKGAV